LKVRVVHIITMLELGGAQEATLCTVEKLDRSRYDVSLITGGEALMTPDARAITDLEFIEVPELVREISPARDLAALVRITGIIRRLVRESPGGVLVHTHSSKAGIIGRWAAWLGGARVIVHSIHGFGFNDFQAPLKRWMLIASEKLTALVTHGFTADSQDNINRGTRHNLFKRSLAEVVRCAIPVSRFGAAPERDARLDIGVPEGAPLAVMVSCLKPQKAPVDFARVAARVLERVPDAHFVHAGDGVLRDAVMEEVERLGISERFHMLGWRRDVREIIHASDVIVLTSLWEGLPRVIPEAMAAGKPVVATAVDGTPEAVRDGVNGFLAAPHDVNKIAERLAELLGDKALAAGMGAAGRKMVSEFDESEMLRRTQALYEALLKEKR